MDRIITFTEKIMLIIAATCIFLMLLSIVYGVFSREVLNAPVIWTNDFAGYLMVYSVFLAAPWILKHDGHVKVDLILGILKGKVLKFMNCVIFAVSAIASFIFFWYSLKVTLSSYSRGVVLLDNIPWPEYLLLLPLAIGTFFLTIRFLLLLIKELLTFKTTANIDIDVPEIQAR
ncbi:TRAP transporter small permease [Oceanobacillus halophilus]|uniref:TRAP transporter small permease n=1 Tax=Oceanobacillus halophilus TaxID=930130 RepID=UPI0013148FB0|nr:TRAP transporter small permease subunit [Oceanobacillus halophilus]